MSRIAFSWTPILFAFGAAFCAGFISGILAGYAHAPPTLSTMEAVIDRAGMRWGRQDTLRYCSTASYMHPPFPADLVDAELLAARDGADVGTLVCYWRLTR